MNEFNKRIDDILYKHRWWVDYPHDEPALDNEQAAAAIRQAVLELVIGEDEPDNFKTSVTVAQGLSAPQRNKLRAQQRSVLGIDKDKA